MVLVLFFPSITVEDGETHFVVSKDINKKQFVRHGKEMGNPPGFIKKLGKVLHDDDLRELQSNKEADHCPDKHEHWGS